MDKRVVAALLSSTVSELLLLLLLSGDTYSTPPPHLLSDPALIIQFLSISQTISLFLSHKRKRSLNSPSNSKLLLQRRRFTTSIPTNPDSFKMLFNMNSSTFEWLSSLLEPLLECRDPLHSPLNLPVQTRLGIGLFRLSTASDYLEISRRFNVSQAVAKFCVKQLCRVLCTDFRFWVAFPATQTDLQPITQSFQTLTGLPNCCGVIHCTRFILNDDHESVAAQIVSDSSSKILNIVAGFSGKKANQLILKSSTLYHDIESHSLLNSPHVDINGVAVPQYLVGDQGYHLLPWLMFPFHQPITSYEQDNFNSAHDLMMVSAFRTVDSLKKWGVLSKPIKEEHVKTMVAYIGACSILHNALLTREDYSCLSDKSDECLRASQRVNDFDVSMKNYSVDQKAFNIRNALATRATRYR